MKLLTLLLLACLLAYPAVVDVRLETGPLGAGTFFFDFQLNDSDGVFGNAAVIDRLAWAGLVAGPVTLDGTATGDLGAGFHLSDGDPAPSLFNGILIEFLNHPQGVFRFRLELSGSYSGAGFPDLFSFAVLDESFAAVRSAGTGALLEALYSDTGPQLTAFAADAEFGNVAPEILGVPEPSSRIPAACALLAGMVFAFRRTRNR
jgi:hypothetical protein